MSKPEVWFAIPSASPDKCRKVLPIWKNMGYKTAVLQNFARGDIPADISVWSDTYPGWPASVNYLCRQIVPGHCPIVVSGGDDMLPDPDRTAGQLADEFLARFPDTFGVMQPHGDEFLASTRYCGSPFLGRAWFESMYAGRGGMHGRYHHNWADNELFWVAKGLGALWSRPDVTHHHDHFTRGGREQPAYWSNVKARDARDCMLFYARAHEGFPGHEPVGRTERFDRTMDVKQMVLLAEQRLLSMAVQNPYAAALAGALEKCATLGQDVVGIYGFASHTRIAAGALCQPPVKIDCIIDDNTAHHGKRAWNIPVVSAAEALKRGLKAVVLSGSAVEDQLWASAAVFRDAGIPVHRLYEAAGPSLVASPTDAGGLTKPMERVKATV